MEEITKATKATKAITKTKAKNPIKATKPKKPIKTTKPTRRLTKVKGLIAVSLLKLLSLDYLAIDDMTLVSIHISPLFVYAGFGDNTLPSRFTQKYNAIGTYSDGIEKIITKDVTWRNSNSDVLSMTKSVAFSKRPGTSEISASLGQITSDVFTVEVVDYA